MRVGAILRLGGPVPFAAEDGESRVFREARVRLGERAAGEHGSARRLHAPRVAAGRAEAGRGLRGHATQRRLSRGRSFFAVSSTWAS